MKTQIARTSQVNANKKLDELNNLLMSHIDSNVAKCEHNLTNLRDVLNEAHRINNNSKINPQESLNFLIDFIKSEQKDSNNNQIIEHHQTDTIISRIENDLQESFKILKQYNEKVEKDRFDLEMEACRKSRDIKYERIRDDNENDEDESCGYNFNRNDVVRKNFFAKSENLGEKLKRLSQINKKNSISEANCKNDEALSRDLSRKSSSPSVRQVNSQRRNSFDHTALLKNSKPKTLTKSTTSQFEKLNSIGADLPLLTSGVRHSESGFWKYDELNELKQKFISLLSDSNKQENKNYNQVILKI